MAMESKVLLLFALLVFSYSNVEALKSKVRHIQFYMHDIVGGPNATSFLVASPKNFTNPNPAAAMFGSVYVLDNALTVTPERNSTVLGRSQGIYAMSSLENDPSLLMSLTINFISGRYNGSTLSLLGRNPFLDGVREMPIVGGTGIFRLARGYCTARTHSVVQFDTIVGYNVTVILY